MDLLSTIRKEGSRGGRGEFKWSDVQTSTHRENYLGHSLMAPVGRWQKGRDLGWYAKADGDQSGNDKSHETAEERAARERKEEIKRVKEAEQDALARALGFDVPKGGGAGNANLVPVGDGGERKAMERTIQDGLVEDEVEGVKGVGFGGYSGRAGMQDSAAERLEGSTPNGGPRSNRKYNVQRPRVPGRDDRQEEVEDSKYRRDKRRHRRRSRSRSRSRSPYGEDHRDHRDRPRERDVDRRKREDSRDRHYHRRPQSRSRDRNRDRDHHHRRSRRDYGEPDSYSRSRSQSRSRDRRNRQYEGRPRSRDYHDRRDRRHHRYSRSRSRSGSRSGSPGEKWGRPPPPPQGRRDERRDERRRKYD